MMQRFSGLGKDWKARLMQRQGALRLALLAFCGLALGVVVANEVEIRLWRGMPPPPAPRVERGTTEARAPARKFEDYDGLLERNLMQVELRRAAMPEAAAPLPEAVTAEVEDAPPQQTSLPAELLGTLGGDDEVAVALIRDRRNREVELYRVGDSLFRQAVVLRIGRGEVEVLRGNNREILLLDEVDAPPPPPEPEPAQDLVERAPEPGEAPDLVISEAGDNNWEIDRESFDEVLKDLGPLLTQARVVPNFRGGRIDGYKIFAIREDSLFEKIGLQNGDVIRNVNGVGVNTPERALQLFQQLRSETDFRIDIEREGAAQTFSYRLR